MSSFNTDSVKILEKMYLRERTKGEVALQQMATLYQSLDAICNTDAGKAILKLDLESIEGVMLKICSGDTDVSSREHAMFDYLVNVRIPHIVAMLKNYLSLEEKFDK